MQQVLPIFPEDIKMVNYQVGFKQVYDFVHYFVKHTSLLSSRRKGGYLLFFIYIYIHGCTSPTTEISPNLTLIRGDINGAIIKSGRKRLVVYGDPAHAVSGAEIVLFTHARRDVIWAGKNLVMNGAKAIVPSGESGLFTRVDSFWNDFTGSRFHDYIQQSSKWLAEPLDVHRTVSGGDSFQWQGIPIRVIDSKGYTRGAVSYLAHIDGMDVAFVGDLIYDDGQILDIYSMQDYIQELNVGGYHGYAARISDLITSLEKLDKLKPDMLVPVRGPVIEEPAEAITKLVTRLRKLYENYLSVNAYRWYTGQEKHDIMAERVLPPDMPVDWMPMAETGKNPYWLIHHGNSKLIISEDGTGFLIDCGSKGVFNDMMKVEEKFPCSDIEGMFITHYHDDHTDYVNGIRGKYNCPVYVTQELEDILKNPQAYRLPAMTSIPMDSLVIVQDASTVSWKEFTFTFYYLPGQTIYHDAMLVEKKDGEKIFLAGDSFAPTGLDDYCLLNRNFIQPGTGYLYCLDLLRKLPGDCWIVNQHIEPPFKFTVEQLDFMTQKLHERKKLMSDLFPWDDPNYGIDERWARMYPYGQAIQPGHEATVSVFIQNHSDRANEYTIRPVPGPDGLTVSPEKMVIKVPPGEEGGAEFVLQASENASPGIRIQTVDIGFNEWNLHEWCESIIEVQVPTIP
jgi:glyoxylase-like metal-dependent hydrolase (beta-lactamase superfamily II)